MGVENAIALGTMFRELARKETGRRDPELSLYKLGDGGGGSHKAAAANAASHDVR